MIIVDCDKDSFWSAFIFDYTQYMNTIMTRVSCKVLDSTATIYIDDEAVSSPEEISDLLENAKPSELRLYLDRFVEITPYGNSILVSTKPLLSIYPLFEIGETIWYSVKYLGNGRIEEGDNSIYCRDVYSDYKRILDFLYENDMYYIWDNPDFPEPLILVSNGCDFDDANTPKQES